MYKVVITDLLRPVVPEEAILSKIGAELLYGECKTEQDLIELARDADAVISVLARITPKVIDSLEKCRVIVRRGVGFDNVDIEAAATKGIPVANVTEHCIDDVADHTLALMLAMARRVVAANGQVKSGGWNYREFLPLPALRDYTLGLVGFGKIPRAVTERAKCFGMKIVTADPFVEPDSAAEYGVELVELEELLKTADIVSVHAPLTNETRGMFNRQTFDMMKPGVLFINTSRGPLVDEQALSEALKDGKIALAALDVMTSEPPKPDNPLLQLDNIVITPHIAWYSERSARVVGEKTAEEILRVFDGCFPKSLVNPEVMNVRGDLKRADT
jgi:D-3-phosphoglycerate dehydrogenase